MDSIVTKAILTLISAYLIYCALEAIENSFIMIKFFKSIFDLADSMCDYSDNDYREFTHVNNNYNDILDVEFKEV